MRLVIVCIVLFLAPAGCLLVTNRFVGNIEGDFMQDSLWQINRFNRISEMYPPRAATLKNAAAILHLKQFHDGGQIATAVCGPLDSPYKRLFDRLSIRCGEWSVLRRSRNTSLLGIALAVFTLALVLIARIGVQRYENRKEWAGFWTTWFAGRGLQILLAVQVTAALAGFAILLQVLLGRPIYAYAALILPWMGLFWVERRSVYAFVEPSKIVVIRPTRRARGVRARV